MDLSGLQKAKTDTTTATKDDKKVRLSHDLSEGEIEATQKRRKKVLSCLQSLQIPCGENKVPNIVVLGSGGGLRAMLAMLGTLVELKKQNLLDAVTYLCGVSGSTWCMSLLYRDGKWSENLLSLKDNLCEELNNLSWSIKKAEKSLEESSEDELYSLTDFWASFLVYQVLKQFDEKELAEHKEASETGTNPYPIYAAVDKDTLNKDDGLFPGTWFEFTPHEAGYSAFGAFVSTNHFGSQFEGGMLKKKGKKKTICYMQGLWGSAIGSMEENLKFIQDHLPRIFPHAEEPVYLLRDASSVGPNYVSDTIMAYQSTLLLLDLQLCALNGSDPKEVFNKLLNLLSGRSAAYQLCLEMHDTWAMKTKEERMKSCADLGKEIEKELKSFLVEDRVLGLLPSKLIGSMWNVSSMVFKTIRCVLTWRWGTTNNFLYNCPNIQPSYLVENKTISLIDAGLAINSAYPLVLRAQRQADLIISFDFSAGDPFQTIKKTAAYCQKNHIRFPKIEEKEFDVNNPSDCYVFRGGDSCPTVMHIPLFNNVNCSVIGEDQAGPERALMSLSQTTDEAGEIEQYRKRFPTFSKSFPKGDVEDLLQKAGLNVSNNRGKILEEIKWLVTSPHANKF